MLVRIVAWVLAIILPSTDRLPGLDVLDTKPQLRAILSEAPLSIVLALYGSVLLFMITPVLTIGWPLPAFALSRRNVDRHARHAAGHRLYLMRQAMLMIKTIAGLIWGGHATVRQALKIKAYGPDPGTFLAGGEAADALYTSGRPAPTGPQP